MKCLYTSKDRPFCWGKDKNGFCKFLETPNIVDTKIKQKPKIFFNCKLECEQLFSPRGTKTCKYYRRGIKSTMNVLEKLRIRNEKDRNSNKKR